MDFVANVKDIFMKLINVKLVLQISQYIFEDVSTVSTHKVA